MESKPTKSDIEAVFHRLRAIATNKACFDCNAKNPTWSSVTYGVFICIDCSAVHRNLGVHLTFVRSTQLDTNWTWVQLRQMQLGGNANAHHFFRQHNCITTDAQKKYNSRAAQLYRDKLHNLALNAIKNNSELSNSVSALANDDKLHLNAHVEEKVEEKEVDFFAEHENFTSPDEITVPVQKEIRTIKEEEKMDTNPLSMEGPKVDFSLNNTMEERKSTIGVRKQQKKSGLGAKKTGLGATKVKTNFAQLEREAELAEESKTRAYEEVMRASTLSAQEKMEKESAMRLAYKDIGMQQQRKEEQLRKIDPKKAEQMERLGMGMGANTKIGISHSMLSDMKTIEQENVQSTPSTLSTLGKLRLTDSDSFFEDFSFSSTFNMNRNANSNFWISKDSSSERVVVDDPPTNKISDRYDRPEKPVERTPRVYDNTPATDMARKKFGNAKGISSDQMFDDGQKDYETQVNLNRFQGSSSISSSDFFGTGQNNHHNHSSFQTPDLDDVRESVRQGVTKVAGKLSSLANGMMSSIIVSK